MNEAVARAVEVAARDSHGRLVAWLARRCGDLLLAEDALADALERALLTWPRTGVPDRPEAWLLTTARRRVIDRVRRDDTRSRAADQLRRDAEEMATTRFRSAFPDKRLELLFLCAHPEVPARDRTPLMLQTVLGLDAKRIGSAFLVAPKTMGQRLVRVKRRIAEAGLALDDVHDPAARLPFVLDAIYAAYGAGFDGGTEGRSTGLAEEALWLARLVVHHLPDDAEGRGEALGLLALISFSLSRRGARYDDEGRFVPLEAQDPTSWDEQLVLEGEKALWIGAKLRQPGRYQVEASIQSVHAHRARSGTTDWPAVHAMYRTLVRQYPSVGAAIGYAASFGSLGRPAEGLNILEQLDGDDMLRHQPYWAVKAHLARLAGRLPEADDALQRAIGLTEDPAIRAWLAAQQA